MKKKTTIIILTGVILILAIVSVILGVYVTNNYVSADNDEKIVEMAKKYVLNFNEEAEITDVSEIVEYEDFEIVSLIVKYKEGNEEDAYCVYLSKDNVLNMYEVQGAIETEIGEVVASSQHINGRYVAFIRGINIPGDVSNYSVKELKTTGEVKNGWCLKMVETDGFDSYDVTIE